MAMTKRRRVLRRDERPAHELDAPPWRRVESTLMATANAIRAAYDDRLAPLGLSLSLASLLSYVADFGPVTQTRAAEHLGQGRAVTGTQIDRLESLGLRRTAPRPDRSPGLAHHVDVGGRRTSPNRSPTSTGCSGPSSVPASRAPTVRRSPPRSCATPTRISIATHPPTGSSIMTNAVIVDAVRTPGGRRNGKLKDWHPADLAAHVLKALAGAQRIRPGHRRRRHHGLCHAGRRTGTEHRPQRRARPPAGPSPFPPPPSTASAVRASRPSTSQLRA